METNSRADRTSAQFVLRLARALHTSGMPSHQVEDILGAMAVRLRIPMQFFATPTAIMVSSGPFEDEQVHLMRVEPGEQNLGRLGAVFSIARSVLRSELTPAEGIQKLDEAEQYPRRYGRVMSVLAMGVSSGAAARFLGGGAREVALAAVVGLVIGLLAELAAKVTGVGRMFEPLAALIAATLTALASHLFGPLAVSVATLAGIIILIPGYTLTVAIAELSHKHLQSGTSRLFGALTTFILIAVGVAMGGELIASILGETPAADPVALPRWTEGLALLAAPLAFTVLLKAQPGALPWILLTCLAGFVGTRLGSLVMAPELGVFVGALVVGLLGSTYFRINGRPPAIVQVPGILLLVPGSVGFRSLTALLDQEVVSGVETAFKTITMAAALAAGLLIASVAAPTRITHRT